MLKMRLILLFFFNQPTSLKLFNSKIEWDGKLKFLKYRNKYLIMKVKWKYLKSHSIWYYVQNFGSICSFDFILLCFFKFNFLNHVHTNGPNGQRNIWSTGIYIATGHQMVRQVFVNHPRITWNKGLILSTNGPWIIWFVGV